MLTIIDLLLLTSLQPPVPVTVYVISAFPGINVVTTPVVALTEATAGLVDAHVPPKTVEVYVVFTPVHIGFDPLKTPVFGNGVTTISTVDAILVHPK